MVYKKGKFSAIEERQLREAIENYRIVSLVLLSCSKKIPSECDFLKFKQLSHEQLNELIFVRADKSKDSTFWSEISTLLPPCMVLSWSTLFMNSRGGTPTSNNRRVSSRSQRISSSQTAGQMGPF